MRRLARRFGLLAPLVIAISGIVGGLAAHPAWTAPPDDVPQALCALDADQAVDDFGVPELESEVVRLDCAMKDSAPP